MTAHIDDDEKPGVEVLLFTMLALFAASFCRVGIRKLPFDFPLTVVLFVIGFCWGALPDDDAGELGRSSSTVSVIGPRFFLNVFLPSLIFYGVFEMKWYMFRSSMVQILLLAVPGVVITMSLTALVTKAFIEDGFSWAQCFLLGAVLSATDPVAVVALMRKSHAPLQVITVLEGESLINDGIAMVAFEACLGLVTKGSVDGGEVIEQILQLSFGALALGLIWGIVIIWILGRIQADAIVEIMLCFTSSYLLFYIAEYECEFSGILAVVVYGMCFPAFGKTRFSPGMGKIVEEFLSVTCYMSESLVFILAGVLIYERVGFDEIDGADYGRAILLWILVMVIRLVMLAILSPLLVRSYGGFDWRRAAVYSWGGLRGAVALALALDIHSEEDVEHGVGQKILFYTAAVTMLTLVVNAPLSAPLLRWMAGNRDADETVAQRKQFKRGIDFLTNRTVAKVEELKEVEHLRDAAWNSVETFARHNKEKGIHKRLPESEVSSVTFNQSAMTLKEGRLLFLRAIKRDYDNQVNNGSLRWSAAQTLSYVADALEDTISRAGASSLLMAEGSEATLSVPAGKGSRANTSAVATDVVNYLHNPRYLGFLKKHFTSWPFSTLVDMIALEALGNAVNALDGLQHAYSVGIRIVKETCAGREADTIIAEAKETWNNAQRILDNIQRKYPAEIRHIRSNSAAMRVLSFQLEELDSRGSAFTVEELEAVRKAVLTKQHKLIHDRVPFQDEALPDDRQVHKLNRHVSANLVPRDSQVNLRGESGYMEVQALPVSPSQNTAL